MFSMAVDRDCGAALTYNNRKSWQEIKTNFCKNNKTPATAYNKGVGKITLNQEFGIISGLHFIYRSQSILS